MLAEIFITETEPSGEQFNVSFALVGPPQMIAKEIATHQGDLHALCIEGKLKCYTLLTAFIDNSGKVHVR